MRIMLIEGNLLWIPRLSYWKLNYTNNRFARHTMYSLTIEEWNVEWQHENKTNWRNHLEDLGSNDIRYLSAISRRCIATIRA